MDNKDVNIYFTNDKTRDNTLKDSTPYERYIILMNESLQSENKKLCSENNVLESRISELEEENEEINGTLFQALKTKYLTIIKHMNCDLCTSTSCSLLFKNEQKKIQINNNPV